MRSAAARSKDRFQDAGRELPPALFLNQPGEYPMDLRGFAKFSLVDYPGRIACIVFSGGCNLRCPFCHNPCLVLDPASQPRVTEREFFKFLDSRRGLLEGVVISGGEPTLQKDLPEFVAGIRERGFMVKLDTNGTRPEVLSRLLEAPGVDALGIDYKLPAARYSEVAADPESGRELADKVAASLRLALASGIEPDVRTTVHRAMLSPDDLKRMWQELSALGVKRWFLQQFNPVEVLADGLEKLETYADSELARLARSLDPSGAVRVRGLHGREIQFDARQHAEL